MRVIRLGTFSIVALDKKTGKLGVAVATKALAVGDRVPHVRGNVGAIATQAHTNTSYGRKGLTLLELGFTPEQALRALLEADPRREKRQVFIIDKLGRAAAHTGSKTNPWNGHRVAQFCVAGGNLLANKRVVDRMIEAFTGAKGELEERLMQALEAGQEAGGDRRGKQSAAIRVERKRRNKEDDPYLDLRVDDHTCPVRELRRVFELWKGTMT